MILGCLPIGLIVLILACIGLRWAIGLAWGIIFHPAEGVIYFVVAAFVGFVVLRHASQIEDAIGRGIKSAFAWVKARFAKKPK